MRKRRTVFLIMWRKSSENRRRFARWCASVRAPMRYRRVSGRSTRISIEFVLDRLMEQGRREGILSQQNPGLCRTAFLAQLMAYVASLISEKGWNREVCPVEGCGVSAEEAKRFVYASLVKSLNE